MSTNSNFSFFSLNDEQIIIMPGSRFSKSQLKIRLKEMNINDNNSQDKIYLNNLYDSALQEYHNRLKIIEYLRKDTYTINSRLSLNQRQSLYDKYNPLNNYQSQKMSFISNDVQNLYNNSNNNHYVQNSLISDKKKDEYNFNKGHNYSFGANNNDSDDETNNKNDSYYNNNYGAKINNKMNNYNENNNIQKKLNYEKYYEDDLYEKKNQMNNKLYNYNEFNNNNFRKENNISNKYEDINTDINNNNNNNYKNKFNNNIYQDNINYKNKNMIPIKSNNNHRNVSNNYENSYSQFENKERDDIPYNYRFKEQIKNIPNENYEIQENIYINNNQNENNRIKSNRPLNINNMAENQYRYDDEGQNLKYEQEEIEIKTKPKKDTEELSTFSFFSASAFEKLKKYPIYKYRKFILIHSLILLAFLCLSISLLHIINTNRDSILIFLKSIFSFLLDPKRILNLITSFCSFLFFGLIQNWNISIPVIILLFMLYFYMRQYLFKKRCKDIVEKIVKELKENNNDNRSISEEDIYKRFVKDYGISKNKFLKKYLPQLRKMRIKDKRLKYYSIISNDKKYYFWELVDNE